MPEVQATRLPEEAPFQAQTQPVVKAQHLKRGLLVALMVAVLAVLHPAEAEAAALGLAVAVALIAAALAAKAHKVSL